MLSEDKSQTHDRLPAVYSCLPWLQDVLAGANALPTLVFL